LCACPGEQYNPKKPTSKNEIPVYALIMATHLVYAG